MNIEDLEAILSYDPESGEFTWASDRSNKVRIGSRAGSINSHGYRQIRVIKKNYKEHRLAWAFMTGSWPDRHIDHINGSRDDNRWVNLRLAFRYENQSNQSINTRNTTGIKCIYWHSGGKCWEVQIRHKGATLRKSFRPSKFDSAEAAKNAAIDWLSKKRIEIHGSFASDGVRQ